MHTFVNVIQFQGVRICAWSLYMQVQILADHEIRFSASTQIIFHLPEILSFLLTLPAERSHPGGGACEWRGMDGGIQLHFVERSPAILDTPA